MVNFLAVSWKNFPCSICIHFENRVLKCLCFSLSVLFIRFYGFIVLLVLCVGTDVAYMTRCLFVFNKGKMKMADISTVSNASKIQMDFMNMLVAELKNQNPLEPMDSHQMTSQLSELQTLSYTEEMNSNVKELNSSFDKILLQNELDYASSIIGKKVVFENEGYTYNGVIESAGMFNEDVKMLVGVQMTDPDTGSIEDYSIEIGLDDVIRVQG